MRNLFSLNKPSALLFSPPSPSTVRSTLQPPQVENENSIEDDLKSLSDPASTPPRQSSRRRTQKSPVVIENSSNMLTPPARDQKRCPPPTPRKSFSTRKSSISKGGDDVMQGTLFILNQLEDAAIDSTHFTRLGEIGTGDFGEVWKGKLKKTGDHYAIKQSHLHRTLSKQQIQHQVAVVKRLAGQSFLNDLERDGIETPKKLKMPASNWHANILRHERIWREMDGVVFMQTELCSCHLKEYITNEYDQRTLKETDFFRILMQVGSALSFMHASGLVHMDVKPDNILARHEGSTEDQEFVLGDLGSVVFANERKDLEEGDSRYLAPEVLREQLATGAADVFSLGLTLYELLSGVELLPNGETWRSFRSAEVRSDLEAIAKEETLRAKSIQHLVSPKEENEWDEDLKDPPPSSFLNKTRIRVSPLLKHIIWRMIHPNPEKRLVLPPKLYLLSGGSLDDLEGDPIWKSLSRYFPEILSQSCLSSFNSSTTIFSSSRISHTAPTRLDPPFQRPSSPSVSYIQHSPPNSPSKSRSLSPVSFFDTLQQPFSLPPPSLPGATSTIISQTTLMSPALESAHPLSSAISPTLQALSMSGPMSPAPLHIEAPSEESEPSDDPMSLYREYHDPVYRERTPKTAKEGNGSFDSDDDTEHDDDDEPSRGGSSLFELSPPRKGSLSSSKSKSKSRSLFGSTVRPRLQRHRRSWYRRARSPHSPESPHTPVNESSKSPSPHPIAESPLRSSRGIGKGFFDTKTIATSPVAMTTTVTPPRKLRARRSFAAIFDYEEDDTKTDEALGENNNLPEFMAPAPKILAAKKILDNLPLEIEMSNFTKDLDGGADDDSTVFDDDDDQTRCRTPSITPTPTVIMDTDSPIPSSISFQVPSSTPQASTPRSLSFTNAFSLPRSLSASFSNSFSKFWSSDLLTPLRGNSVYPESPRVTLN